MFKLAYEFTLIGLLTFGGGSSVTPIIDAFIVKKRRWITEDEFLEVLTLANLLPGPSMIQMAAAIGYKKGKTLGSIISAVCISLPSMILFLAVMLVLGQFFNYQLITQVTLGVFIILGLVMVQTCLSLNNNNYKLGNLVIILITFILVTVFNFNPSLVIIMFLAFFIVKARWFR